MSLTSETISVVIPCFNSGAFLCRAVDSLLNQTSRALEIIIVNDGSTETETNNLLDVLKNDQRLIIIDLISNQGLPTARNVGARVAQGKYILFLDADDWYEDTALETMIRNLPKNRADFFVYCDITLEGNRSGILRRPFLEFSQLFVNGIPCSILLPKKAFTNEGPYKENMRAGMEDWHLNLSLVNRGFTPVRIPLPLFHYYESSLGMYISKTKQLHFAIWRSIKSSLPELYSGHSLRQRLISQVKKSGLPSVIPALMVLGLSRIPNDQFATKLLLSLKFVLSKLRVLRSSFKQQLRLTWSTFLRK